MAKTWRRVAELLLRRGRLVLVGVVALTVAFAGGLPRLAFETSQASLISPDSDVYQVAERYQDAFGGEPMLVLWSAPATEVVQGGNLEALRALEAELRETGRFPAVLGPAGALDLAVAQLPLAPELAPPELIADELGRLGAVGAQDLTNPAFVEFLLTDADGEIRAALRDNFPDPEHALLLVRLRGNLSIAEQGEDADVVRQIVQRHPLEGAPVLATGPPVLLKEINDYLRGGMATLGLLAGGVMVLLLFTVFRARWRLLSLGVVLLGLVWAFGALGYLGVPLSMVTISGLPILLGLGVDFAVQTHNRFEESRRDGGSVDEAALATMTHMAPPLTVAMVAAVAGFAALRLSAVPMIDDFALLLGVGLVVLVVEAIVLSVGLLVWRDRRRPAAVRSRRRDPVARAVRRLTRLSPRWAMPLVAAGLLVGAAGLAVEGRTPVQTDPELWVGEGNETVQDLFDLRDGTGYSSELGFLVEADDVTSTEVTTWLVEWTRRQLASHPDELVSGTSLAGITGTLTVDPPTGDEVSAFAGIASEDVLRSFVTDDGRAANVIFPIAPLSLAEREALLAEMVADLDPPEGVTVTPSGLAVLGIELVNALEANRQLLTLAAIGLVALWLLLVHRRLGLVLVTLVPVTVAVGASALAIDLLDLQLTPLTTVSGPLAIAITTEFSVLLVARYREERARGATAAVATDEAAERIGRAFLASGLTLLGGFVVLALSPMALLVDFGIVVALDVALALLTVLVLLPPLLRWMGRDEVASPDRRPTMEPEVAPPGHRDEPADATAAHKELIAR